MFSRRHALALMVAGTAGLAGGRGGFADDGAPILGDDGLWHQPWFLQSFLELADDHASATDAGKRFAVMWELKGCPYCKETHFVNFARPDIREFVTSRFDILQLNIIGARLVTDFDGEELPEKELARKYAVRFTPTFQFFHLGTDLGTRPPPDREAARAQGYLQPDHFLAMFRFVDSEGYRSTTFRRWLEAGG